MKQILAGTTDYTLYVKILDSSKTDGSGLAGLAFNTSGLTASYVRNRGARTAISLVTQTVTGAHSDGGFVEIDSTNCKGLYRLDLPDAAIAASADKCIIYLYGAANMAETALEIELVAYNPQDSNALGLGYITAAVATASALSTVSTNVSTVLSRIGAFTGSGVNTVLGFFQALFRSDASTPSDIGGTFDPSTESTQALRDHIGNGTNLTEAGGTGDHLSAVPDTSGTATLLSRLSATRAGYLDNLSAGAVATAAKLLAFFQLAFRSDAAIKTDNAAELTEINANEGSGAGDFDNETEALEAIVDTGNASWTTGSGTGLTALATGTAQAGAAGTITLAAGASATDDLFKHAIVKITGGTGAGQARPITGYVGSSKVASVTPNWTTNPDATSVYEIVEGGVDVLAVGGVAEDIATETKQDIIDTNVDTILTGAAAAKYLGPLGPGVYIDTTASNTNTALGTDGTSANPVSTLAAAVTLCGSLGVNRIYVAGGSTVSLAGQTLTDYDFIGTETVDASILNLGTAASNSILTRFRAWNLTVYGEHDLSDRIELNGCIIDDAPAAEITKLHVLAEDCILVGDLTLDTSADNVFFGCVSAVSGGGYPTVTATGASGTVQFQGHDGRVGFQNLSASHILAFGGEGQVIFESGCNVNADVRLRGMVNVTDNTAGMNSLTTGAAFGPTIGTPAGASVSADIATIDGIVDTITTNVSTLLTRITSTLFSGITSLGNWLRLLARKDAAIATDAATELGEINLDLASGAGAYANTTDAQEAIRDNQSAGGGNDVYEIKGSYMVTGTTFNYEFWLEKNGQPIGTVSNPTIDILDKDGVSISFSSTPTIVGTDLAKGSGTWSPTNNVPYIVKVTLDYSAVTYTGRLPGGATAA